MRNVMPVVFGEIKMSFWPVRKRPSSIFGKAKATRKYGLSNISFPGV